MLAIQSLDYTQMDFFLWGEMNRLVYGTPLDTEGLVAVLLQLRCPSLKLLAFFNVPDDQWYADATFVLMSMANNFNNFFK